VARPDENADINGRYKTRSLYFDNYDDKVVIDKLSGQSVREKFRLRYYNDDISFIRLEKKNKANRLAYKDSVNDVSAYFTYEQYKASLPVMTEFGSLRAESIKGQLDGTIPPTSSGQSADSSSLVDASSIELSALGSMMGGGGMGQGGFQEWQDGIQGWHERQPGGQGGMPNWQNERPGGQGGWPGGNDPPTGNNPPPANQPGGSATGDPPQTIPGIDTGYAVTIVLLLSSLTGAIIFVAKPRGNQI